MTAPSPALALRCGALRGEAPLVLDGVLVPATYVAVDGMEATLGSLDRRIVTVSLAEGSNGR